MFKSLNHGTFIQLRSGCFNFSRVDGANCVSFNHVGGDITIGLESPTGPLSIEIKTSDPTKDHFYCKLVGG
jgi:hypothetical protein